MKERKNYAKIFWNFLQKDTWPSFATTLILAFIIIKFVFFPLLSLITGTALPLVIVESCSMYHQEYGFEKIFESSNLYDQNNIGLGETNLWDFPNGFNKGDVIFIIGVKEPKIGDVLVFNAGSTHPLIHRVISEEPIGTKGDNRITNSAQLPTERNISKDQLIGKALFKIPAIGWIKLIFFEFGRPTHQRGIC
jgi:signal peptidase I